MTLLCSQIQLMYFVLLCFSNVFLLLENIIRYTILFFILLDTLYYFLYYFLYIFSSIYYFLYIFFNMYLLINYNKKDRLYLLPLKKIK